VDKIERIPRTYLLPKFKELSSWELIEQLTQERFLEYL
jgi:hypothetical protein